MLKSNKIRNAFTIIVLISAISFFSCTSIKTDFNVKPYEEQMTIYKHNPNGQVDSMIPEKVMVVRYALEMRQVKYLDVPKTIGLVAVIGAGTTVLAYTVAQIWVISWLPW